MRTDLEVYLHTHPTDDTWILRFTHTTNPLPMNGAKGTHWGPRHRKAAQVRRDSAALARAARIPLLGRCRTQLTWWVNDNRTRDPDNLAPFEKPIYDGLVDARVVPDDKPAFMDKPRPLIRRVTEADGLITEPCFTLHITRLDDEEWDT